MLAKVKDVAVPRTANEPPTRCQAVAPHLEPSEHERCVPDQPPCPRQGQVEAPSELGVEAYEHPPHQVGDVMYGLFSPTS